MSDAKRTSCRILTSRELVRGVVVRLEIGVGHGHSQARDDRGNVVLGLVCESLGQDVANRDVDRLLEEVMLKNNETSVDFRRVVHDRVPRVQYLHGVSLTASKVVI